MSILVTGGAGYVGCHTAIALICAGHNVVVLDSLVNSRLSAIRCLETITRRKIPVVVADIRNTATVIEAIASYGVKVVVHCAGLKSVGESVSLPIDYYSNNVQGTISVLQAMNATNVRKLVFSSSATVYGNPHYLPLDENHPTSVTNPYGRTKLQIEQILTDVAGSDGAWRIACLRYFNPAGAHGSGLIGDDPLGTPNNLLPYVARVASGKIPYLSVFGDDYPTRDGTGVRDYIHIMDLAEGHLSALEFLDMNSGWHAFNLGTGRGSTVLEVIKAFQEASGMAVPYKIAARRPGDVASCYAKAEKAWNQLGWRAKRDLKDMCESAWNWQTKSVAT